MNYSLRIWWWAETRDTPRRRGLRIERGPVWVWVADEDLLSLANDIADYLETKNTH